MKLDRVVWIRHCLGCGWLHFEQWWDGADEAPDVWLGCEECGGQPYELVDVNLAGLMS